MIKKVSLAIILICCSIFAFAQKPGKPEAKPEGPSTIPTELPVADSVTVTVILKHQQDKNLTEIRRKLEANGFWDLFPPEDARVISWNIVMGLGQVITLKMAAPDVRELHLSIQNGAWGAYDTEIYLTYDYLPIWTDFIEKRRETREDKD